MKLDMNLKIENHGRDYLGSDTYGYQSLNIKQMMPLPAGTTVMVVDVDEDDNVVMRDCIEVGQPYCLVLAEDEDGKANIFPFNLSIMGGIDVRGSVEPIRYCPMCHKRMKPHMAEYETGTLYYTCSCGHEEPGWKDVEENMEENMEETE